jgi:hypothetical protein
LYATETVPHAAGKVRLVADSTASCADAVRCISRGVLDPHVSAQNVVWPIEGDLKVVPITVFCAHTHARVSTLSRKEYQYPSTRFIACLNASITKLIRAPVQACIANRVAFAGYSSADRTVPAQALFGDRQYDRQSTAGDGLLRSSRNGHCTPRKSRRGGQRREQSHRQWLVRPIWHSCD